MRIKLTKKGMATSPLTLQGLGLTEPELSYLRDGLMADIDASVSELLEKHEMATEVIKKDEVNDAPGDA